MNVENNEVTSPKPMHDSHTVANDTDELNAAASLLELHTATMPFQSDTAVSTNNDEEPVLHSRLKD